jgi:hypothetical protein
MELSASVSQNIALGTRVVITAIEQEDKSMVAKTIEVGARGTTAK